jgi:dihydroorotate dehydrogenase (NAD+) catalytic subunit
MGISLSVKIGKLSLKNPVLVASGTFGYGEEYKGLVDINKLGAIITKTITLKPKAGNKPPRIAETPQGMLNSIGLENCGSETFIKEKLSFLKTLKTAFIVSIAGYTKEEFSKLAKRLEDEGVKAVELNISCPNIEYRKGKLNFSQDAKSTYAVVRQVKKSTRLTIITKLSPNVTDISEIAKAAEEAGSDALSLINTLLGMAVNISTRTPLLGNITGGLSGPAVKPVALRMIWEAYNSVKIPLVGMGGIMDASDAIEFIISGAAAIGIGTANFINPEASLEIIGGIKKYMKENKIKNVKSLIGTLKCPTRN